MRRKAVQRTACLCQAPPCQASRSQAMHSLALQASPREVHAARVGRLPVSRLALHFALLSAPSQRGAAQTVALPSQAQQCKPRGVSRHTVSWVGASPAAALWRSDALHTRSVLSQASRSTALPGNARQGKVCKQWLHLQERSCIIVLATHQQ